MGLFDAAAELGGLVGLAPEVALRDAVAEMDVCAEELRRHAPGHEPIFRRVEEIRRAAPDRIRAVEEATFVSYWGAAAEANDLAAAARATMRQCQLARNERAAAAGEPLPHPPLGDVTLAQLGTSLELLFWLLVAALVVVIVTTAWRAAT